MTSDVMALNEYCRPITMYTLRTRVRGWGTTTITSIDIQTMDTIDKQSYLLDTCNTSNASHPKTIQLNSIVVCTSYEGIVQMALLGYGRLQRILTPIQT